jgi:tetratricopeptide (TPR) repeat protein
MTTTLELAKIEFENKNLENCIKILEENLKDSAESFYYLGLAYKEKGSLEEAKKYFEKSFFINPLDKNSCNALGNLHFTNNELNESANYFLNTLKNDPKDTVANNYIGTIFTKTNKLKEACGHFETILDNEKNPLIKAIAAVNLGNCVARLDDMQKSIEYFEKSISLFPEGKSSFTVQIGLDVHALSLYLLYYNLGLSYERLKTSGVIDHKKAIECFEKAISYENSAIENGLNPSDAYLELGLNYLTIGNYKDGWKKFEYRWNTDRLFKVFESPVYVGDGNYENKNVLVYSEQGFGDTLQFIRYVKLLKKKNPKKIIVVTYKPLVKLLSTIPEIDEIVASGDSHTNQDYHIPDESFPAVFETDIDTIPCEIPYFKINDADIEHWKNKLPSGYKIGVCWSGDPKINLGDYVRIENEKRNISLKQIDELLNIENVNFISLQKEDRKNELVDYPQIINLMNEVGDYYDTAAIISNLDLVVTVDTSVAHVAGALGKPVMMLSRWRGCWRWGTKEFCFAKKWYPTLDIYRETEYNNWGPIIKILTDDVRKIIP